MNKHILIIALVLLSGLSVAQITEIETAENLLNSGDIKSAIEAIDRVETSIAQADTELQSRFYLLKGEAWSADASSDNDFEKMKTAASALSRAQDLGAGSLKGRLDSAKQQLRIALVSSAISDRNDKNFNSTSEKLYTSYRLADNPSDLYYAAESSLKGKDYQTAMSYYIELLDSEYTGVETEYLATAASTGNVVVFSDKGERDLALISRKYTNPDERTTDSVVADIIKKLTLIHIVNGEPEKAMQVVVDARSKYPDDVDLLKLEAELALKTGDVENYSRLVPVIIASDPQNPELYFGLGVTAGELNQRENAIGYYRKSLELRPGYTEAEINIATLLLRNEAGIVAEMNALGTSVTDSARYDELSLQRTALYEEALGYLESAASVRPHDMMLTRKLMNIYLQLGQEEQFMAAKARLASLEETPMDEEDEFSLAIDDEEALDLFQGVTLQAAESGDELGLLNETLQLQTFVYMAVDPEKELAAELAFNRGIELYDEGLLDDAILAFEEAVDALPGFSAAHYELGMAAYITGQYDKAVLHLESFLGQVSEGEAAETARFVLEGMR